MVRVRFQAEARDFLHSVHTCTVAPQITSLMDAGDRFLRYKEEGVKVFTDLHKVLSAGMYPLTLGPCGVLFN
jgi:hypothetical protein